MSGRVAGGARGSAENHCHPAGGVSYIMGLNRMASEKAVYSGSYGLFFVRPYPVFTPRPVAPCAMSFCSLWGLLRQLTLAALRQELSTRHANGLLGKHRV